MVEYHINRTPKMAAIDLYKRGTDVSTIISMFRSEGISLTGPEIRYWLGIAPNLIKPQIKTKIKQVKTVKLKKSKLPEDTYLEEESNNPEKKEINVLLGKLVKELGLTNTKMVVLESPVLLTVKHLNKVGVESYKIHIPNHTLSYDKILKKHNNTYPVTLGNFLKNESPRKYGFIFADYCGTLDGSTLFSPLEDIKTIFSKGLIKSGGLLAITISKRNSKKPNKYINNDVSRLNHSVTYNAHINNYTAIDLGYGRDYNKKMHFAVYKII